jgi:hypothetical protein
VILLDCGKRECGKSTFALRCAQWAPTIVIVDPRGQFELAGAYELARESDDAELATEFREALDTEAIIVVVPRRNVQATLTIVCDELVDWLNDHPGERVALLLDEARVVFPSRREITVESLDWLTRCSSRQNVAVICTAHRPTDYPTNLRAIADIWCFFQADMPEDLDAISERCGSDTARLVASLKPREVVVRDTRGGLYAPVTIYRDPAAWYTPLVELNDDDDDSQLSPAVLVLEQAPPAWLFP